MKCSVSMMIEIKTFAELGEIQSGGHAISISVV